MVYLNISHTYLTDSQIITDHHSQDRPFRQVFQVTATASPCLAARLYQRMACRCNVERVAPWASETSRILNRRMQGDFGVVEPAKNDQNGGPPLSWTFQSLTLKVL